jgi:hypothetical protein
MDDLVMAFAVKSRWLMWGQSALEQCQIDQNFQFWCQNALDYEKNGRYAAFGQNEVHFGTI